MLGSKNILILSSQVPFSSGGAELLNSRLKRAFEDASHRADILSLPFLPKTNSDLISQAAQWRALNLDEVSGRKVDLVIATKFPTYFVKHSFKTVWLVHQHRQAYELLGTRFGDFTMKDEDEALRSSLLTMDRAALKEAKKIYSISRNVAGRLEDFCELKSDVLEPPIPWEMNADASSVLRKGNFILVVGRLCSSKRVDSIIKALPSVDRRLSLKVVGVEDEPNCVDYLLSEVRKHHLEQRVEFLGKISQIELEKLYQSCFCVFYGSYDEDYGFVAFEAAKVQKPLITLSDSGFVAEVVERFGAGLVSLPESEAIGKNINSLLEDSSLYAELQEKAKALKNTSTWSDVVEKFIGLL